MVYTHYRYIVRDKITGETTRTIIARNRNEAWDKIKSSEKLCECIGGANIKRGEE